MVLIVHYIAYLRLSHVLVDKQLVDIAYQLNTLDRNTNNKRKNNKKYFHIIFFILLPTTFQLPNLDNNDLYDIFQFSMVFHQLVHNNYLQVHVHYVNTIYVDDVQLNHIVLNIYSMDLFANEDNR